MGSARKKTGSNGDEAVRTALYGQQLLTDPYLNKGSAFSEEESA